ncbi:Transposase, Mutator family [Candidatus Arcanobacter lacustris]|uniref:Mutator family transposase n=2 Tax=Candidatus Arcanibacter lacustris TaxID=1607817 RepID=A0A0F5MPJ8_9RICK|nr:Transposase, Mutator family [Candidatus Arcanobacter lacustris]KKB96507.1 Transposase, Mutator family [Candidatus Arcanobacter lacustris]KKB96537.1 Transposase, Mutator family [Candidatus Arcanobacter lacustris]
MNKVVQHSKMKEALDLLLEGDVDISKALEEGGLIKQLTKAVIERALSEEMNNHLGYDRYSRSDLNNARNGHYNKNLITDNGVIELNVPRDRNGDFEPAIVPKKQNRIAGLDKKILSLYAKGMSLSDIKQQIYELYEAEISESLISKITDGVMDEVKAWQNRPLESVYPIVYFDCLVVKVRHDKRIINKAVYVALGIDLCGKKDILGLWISENEGAKFWLGNLTEMKNRGMQDMLIACTDNLTGMSEAISAVYPKCEHQLCIVHQIRNSLKYVSYKDRKELVADLKPIYTTATEDAALLALEAFALKWDKRYPQISKSWYHNWANLVIFMQYPSSIKKIIYTTNSIESLNSQLRKVTNNKRVFPNDDAVFKSLYLTIDYITAKWNMPIQNWNEAMAHFLIKFEGRI